MYYHLKENIFLGNGRRAADVRRTHTTTRQAANTSCPRVATTAVVGIVTPVGVADVDVVDDNLERTSDNPVPSPAPPFESDLDPSTNLTTDQLDSRRRSNLSASTSSQPNYGSTRPRLASPAASPSGSSLPSSPNRSNASLSDLPWQAPTLRTPPAAPSPPWFPNVQRPTTQPIAPNNRLNPPQQPAVEVPPAAVELYAGTPVAANLSTTAGSSDVLAQLLDALQLEPTTPQAGPLGASSDAQRVYKAGGASSTAAEGASGGAADPGSSSRGGSAAAMQRKRKRLQVLDATELLMARDEAVRTELLGRTWKDLLRFDERLAPGAAGQPTGRSEAAAAGSVCTQAVPNPGAQEQQQGGQIAQEDGSQEVGSLEDLLAAMQQVAAELGKEQQRQGEQQQLQDQQQIVVVPGADALGRVAVGGQSPEVRLMEALREAGSWRQLQTLYMDLRGAFGAPHLALLLFRLARFLHGAARAEMPRRDRVTLYVLFGTVLEQAIFLAPDMVRPQAVSVVRSVSYTPFRFGGHVRSMLDTLQRFLRYSTLGVVLGGDAGQALDGTGSDGDGAILNASKVAATRRGGARAQAAAVPATPPLEHHQGQGQLMAASPGWHPPGPGPALMPPVQPPMAGESTAPVSLQQQQVAGTSEAESASNSVDSAGDHSTAATEMSNSEAAAAATDAVASSRMRVGGLHGPLRGPHYAVLSYCLGCINARARPFGMSLRLPGAIKHDLLRGSYATLPSLRPRDFPRLLFGLALLRISPPAPWLYAFYLTTARALPAMSDIDLTMLIYSACRLAGKPPAPWLEAYLGTLRQRLEHLDTGGLAIVLHALGRLQYKPRPEWLDAHLTAAQAVLASGDGGFKPPELSLLLRGMMFLRLDDQLAEREGLLEAVLQRSGEAMAAGHVSVAQAANMAWALGQMQVTPPSAWVEMVLHLTRTKMPLLRPYHRRRLLAALHAFGRRDLQAWYELLNIPLREMPDYAAMKAREAARRVREAKAQLAKEQRQKEREAKQQEHLAKIAERRREKRRVYKRWWWKIRTPKKLALKLAAMKEQQQQSTAVVADAAAVGGLRVGDAGDGAGGQVSKNGSPEGKIAGEQQGR